MDKKERDFRKACQAYESKIDSLIKSGDNKDIKQLKKQIEDAFMQWENLRKTAKWRTMILRALLAKINSFGGK